MRRRVRGDEAEDVVQATLADVLSAARVPEEPEEFRRFVFGVARNKVFDHFRRQKRHPGGLDDADAVAPEPPLSARDILRWAEGELPDSESQSTLEWMLRESDGEKLEQIARDAQLPATRVRKRVSRLRKFLRDRWAAELMLIGLLLLAAGLGALWWFARGRNPDDFVKREPVRPVPSAPRSLAPSQPAGSAEPIPNLVAPPSSAVPSPSAMPEEQPVKGERVRPLSTEDGRNFPAPVLNGKAPAKQLLDDSFTTDSEPLPVPSKANKPITRSAPEVTAPKPSAKPAPAKANKAGTLLDSGSFSPSPAKDQK